MSPHVPDDTDRATHGPPIGDMTGSQAMSILMKTTLLTTIVCAVMGTTVAQSHQRQPDHERVVNFDTYETGLLQASGHSNEIQRWHGIWAYDNGRLDEARRYFERAAYYGDKLSQHVLSLMCWNGDGGARDPIRAYIWADLAAERGNNADLLQIRERIWSQLSERQQNEALENGLDFYARYGDDVAVPRTNRELRRFLRNQTGSRTGLVTSRLNIALGRPEVHRTAGGGTKLNYGPHGASGEQFYAAARTRPDAYWESEDLSVRMLLKLIEQGRVDVGPVSPVRDEEQDKGH
jgi:hypothetical protein